MLGPFATASRRTPHYHSPGVASIASHAARTPMSTTTTTTTTTTTRERGDRYGPIEWAQQIGLLQKLAQTFRNLQRPCKILSKKMDRGNADYFHIRDVMHDQTDHICQVMLEGDTKSQMLKIRYKKVELLYIKDCCCKVGNSTSKIG